MRALLFVAALLVLTPSALHADQAAAVAAAPDLVTDTPAPRVRDANRRATLERAAPAIAALVAERMAAMRAPGVTWGVVIDGELAVQGSAGVREAGSAAAVDVDTVFRIASMTKSVTALAILLLRDEGRLSLDDAVTRYLPEFAAVRLPTADSPAVTIRHLLTHSGGFPEDNPWGDRQLAIDDEMLTRWLQAGIPFSTAPGTAYEYSNYGFALLGRVVTRVAREPYQAFIARRILQPLGMTATAWDPAGVPPDRLAHGHRPVEGGWAPEPSLADGAFGAIGGLLTSGRDLARYVAFMLDAWPPRDGADPGPVRRSSRREMQQAHRASSFGVDRSAPTAPLRAAATAYGYGLRVAQDCRFAHLAGHSGGLPGFGSNMTWLPEYGVGVYVMANVTYAPAAAVAHAMLGRLWDTGALQPRRLAASRALAAARDRIADFVTGGDAQVIEAIAADNLLLDRSHEDRMADLRRIGDTVGACGSPGEVLPENWLRGSFRMTCARGALDVSFTLAPTMPPRVQWLDWVAVPPLTPAARRAAERVVALTAEWRDGETSSLFSAGAEVGRIRRELESVRLTYGACRVSDPLGQRPGAPAAVRLLCDRGRLDLGLSVDDEGRLRAVTFAVPAGDTCVP